MVFYGQNSLNFGLLSISLHITALRKASLPGLWAWTGVSDIGSVVTRAPSTKRGCVCISGIRPLWLAVLPCALAVAAAAVWQRPCVAVVRRECCGGCLA